MLTATYSLVAIAAEHDAARRVLRRLQQYIQNIWHGIQKMEFGFIDTALGKLGEFDEFCRHRKIELYVIPAVRKATREADLLLDELGELSAGASRVLNAARERLAGARDVANATLHEICLAMELYCDHLFARFRKEEEELMPLLNRLLSVDEWFGIAAQFLSDDAATEGRRRRTLPHLPSAASGPVSSLAAG